MGERPLFDPARIRPPSGPPGPDAVGPATFSVRQVNELIRTTLSRQLPPSLHVLGEIGNLSRPASGHLYFTLKDSHSELQCVMWRSTAARLKFEPQVGMEVIATGHVDVYPQRGTYQLYARRLEPRGIGALEIAFRQLRERLDREGLFDPRRKKPLPRIPQRVAVVTSPSGAAIRDILQTLRRRFPALEILLLPVRVQGEGAAEEIAAGIRLLNQYAETLGGVDVAIVGRGGGSLEDLWAFNEEVVARAIAASSIPIVSAVGHEVDVSISDLVADLRAPTPTAAAELVAPPASELIEWLDQRVWRATRAVSQSVKLAGARLTATLAYDGLTRPVARVRERAQWVDELHQRLRLVTAERFRAVRERLNHAEVVILRFRSGRHFQRLHEQVVQRVYRLHRALGRPVLIGERALAGHLARLERAGPQRSLPRFDEHLHQTVRRLQLATYSLLLRQRRRLGARLEALTAYDPQRVLKRGYSITRDARTRRIIRSIAEIREGLRISTQLPDGQFHANAEDPRQPRLFDP